MSGNRFTGDTTWLSNVTAGCDAAAVVAARSLLSMDIPQAEVTSLAAGGGGDALPEEWATSSLPVRPSSPSSSISYQLSAAMACWFRLMISTRLGASPSAAASAESLRAAVAAPIGEASAAAGGGGRCCCVDDKQRFFLIRSAR